MTDISPIAHTPLAPQDIADVFNALNFTKEGLFGAVAMLEIDAAISERQTKAQTERQTLDTERQEAEARIQGINADIAALEARKKALISGGK